MKRKKTKAKPKAKPAVKVKPPGSALKWHLIEKTLHDLAAKSIKDFAKKHPGEMFYALYFDFPAQWSRIRIHLNTPDLLRKRAGEYIANNPELYARRSVEAIANDIRWEPGDFGYFEINATRGWKMKWNPIAEKIEKAAAKQDPGPARING